jgi:transcriptional regulator with XRE-family HTH domain
MTLQPAPESAKSNPVSGPQDHAALRIREELARRRMSRASLAAQAKISLSSLEKGLSGQRAFTDPTLLRLEDVLGIQLRVAAKSENIIAPDALGSYSRPAVHWLEGNYLCIRPSISKVPAIYVYTIGIAWDDKAAHLTFQEKARQDKDYAQSGDVAVSHQSGHIYLTTNRHGQHRLIILSRQGVTGELHGLLLTLQTGVGARLLPVSMPVALVPFAQLKGTPTFGTITERHPTYIWLKSYLDRVLEGGFAMMLGR